MVCYAQVQTHTHIYTYKYTRIRTPAAEPNRNEIHWYTSPINKSRAQRLVLSEYTRFIRLQNGIVYDGANTATFLCQWMTGYTEIIKRRVSTKLI